MQRPTYGHSPPLHHPVPQHVSTVPQLRSPPPLSNSQPQAHPGTAGYGNPYTASSSTPGMQQHGQPGVAGANMFGNYGQFMNDPTAQVAAQFGQTAFKHGQEYLEQNAKRWFNFASLKPYFNVTNSYVANKLILVLFPWRHKSWVRRSVNTGGASGQDVWYLPPRDDINSPDMYIPVMALVTYVLLSTLVAGLRGEFQPEVLGTTASWAMLVVFLEILILNLGCYLLGISNQSQLLDLIAYSGYKFVGVIVTVAIAEIANGGQGTGGMIGWLVFGYTFLANSLFLMRSLKYVLLPETSNSGPDLHISRTRKAQRTQFLFAYSYIVQLIFMWQLSRP